MFVCWIWWSERALHAKDQSPAIVPLRPTHIQLLMRFVLWKPWSSSHPANLGKIKWAGRNQSLHLGIWESTSLCTTFLPLLKRCPSHACPPICGISIFYTCRRTHPTVGIHPYLYSFKLPYFTLKSNISKK